MSSEIKAAIRKMAKEGGFDVAMDRAVVQSVDKNSVTCTVQLVADDSILENVKLKPVINEGDTTQMGLIFYPAENSFVVVGQIDQDSIDLYVLGMTVIESIALDTATALKLLVTQDGKVALNAVKTTFNNGTNGGIPLVSPLTQIIMKLQQQVNTLIDTFNTHIHPVAGAATGPTATPGPPATAPLIKTADIANKLILQ